MATLLCLAGCQPDFAEEPQFGLGAKADGICEPAADLCWNEADQAAMRAVLGHRIELAAGEASGAWDVIGSALQLDHKLDNDERALLDDARAAWSAGELTPEELSIAIVDGALRRTVGAYYAAHAVPLGASASYAIDGKADSATDEESAPPAGLSDAMRLSLIRLRDAGISGKMFATILEMSGALDVSYQVLDRDSFGPPRGRSRQERVDRVIDKYKRAAAVVGVTSGAISLIPIVGIPLSIPVEVVGIFSVHARMNLEVATLYGWDLNEDENLFIVSMFLLSDGAMEEIGADLASNPSFHQVVKAIAREIGVPVSSTLAVKLAAKIILSVTKFLLKKGAKLLGQAAIEGSGRALAGQILGWATMGLAIIGSGAVDYYITDQVGVHVSVLARRWLVDLPLEGTQYLSTRPARDCFFATLAQIIGADGRVESGEKLIYGALLEKNYYLGDEQWMQLSAEERLRHANRLGTDNAGAHACMERFEDESASDKLTLLSHLDAAVEIDRDIYAAEIVIYDQVRDVLDGDGWWDGPEIEPYMLDYVERAVSLAITPALDEWPLEYADSVALLQPEDILSYLTDVSDETRLALDCSVGGQCQ